jgi:PPP family 3-phenylpropionic acid transporter
MGFESRLALYYAGVFAASGIQLPFLPLWLAAKGLDEQTIGLLLAVSAVVRIAAIPVATRAADRLDALRSGLLLSALVAAIGTTVLGLSDRAAMMFVSYAVASAALSIMIPLVDAYALSGLRARGRAYGPIRMWGSAAFILGNLGAGLLADAIAPTGLIWPIAGAFYVTALTALILLPPPPTSPHEAGRAAGARRLLRTPAVLLVVAASGLIQGSHAVYYGFSALEWRAGGLGGFAIGVLWSIGVVAEIMLFALSARFPASLGPATLLVVGAAGGV